MNGQVNSQSIFLKILQETFGFVVKIAEDIRDGNYIGAATRFAIIALGFFFALFIISIIVSTWNPQANGFCWTALLLMGVISILLLFFIFRQPPDDHGLAGGQSIRAAAINPIPIR